MQIFLPPQIPNMYTVTKLSAPPISVDFSVGGDIIVTLQNIPAFIQTHYFNSLVTCLPGIFCSSLFFVEAVLYLL